MGKVNYCPVQHKEIFTDKSSAQRAAKAFGRRKHSLVTVYQCKTCGGYHLTHYDYNEAKNFDTVLPNSKRGVRKRYVKQNAEYKSYCKRNSIGWNNKKPKNNGKNNTI